MTISLAESNRFSLWVVPEFPIHLPWVRDRRPQTGEEWRFGLLEDIRDNGLKSHIGVYGHQPQGPISKKYDVEWNSDRDRKYVVRLGTNRLWCLMELGHKTFPAVVSINHGSKPPWDGYIIPACSLGKYFTDGTPWVANHAFGIVQATVPEEAYG